MLRKRWRIFDNLRDSQFLCLLFVRYRALHGFWSVEELAELANGSIWRSAVARGECLFAWNFSVTMSAVYSEAESRTRPNTTLR
jgi:hypothetical protein